jgi:hypothetical protein
VVGFEPTTSAVWNQDRRLWSAWSPAVCAGRPGESSIRGCPFVTATIPCNMPQMCPKPTRTETLAKRPPGSSACNPRAAAVGRAGRRLSAATRAARSRRGPGRGRKDAADRWLSAAGRRAVLPTRWSAPRAGRFFSRPGPAEGDWVVQRVNDPSNLVDPRATGEDPDPAGASPWTRLPALTVPRRRRR